MGIFLLHVAFAIQKFISLEMIKNYFIFKYNLAKKTTNNVLQVARKFVN